MAGRLMRAVLAFIIYVQPNVVLSGKGRTFEVDYEHNTFLKDGRPFRYVSGSLHYFRVPEFYWEDRIKKVAAAGLDAIQTYVAWNVHEIEEGVYSFEGKNDLVKFIQLAQKYNLYIILRPGPYICAEWDYGGFPAWLLTANNSVTVRKMDSRYIEAVTRWFSKLLPLIKPYLYVNGGPIIMVQVENEYGSFFACDHDYMDHLAKMMEGYIGSETLLFTTDGNSLEMLKCGTTRKAFATVDFGTTSDVNGAFQPMRDWNIGKGPLVNSELYTGWLDSWGEDHHQGSTYKLINTLKQMEALNASCNMYMFEGGTTFGYMNGANFPTWYQTTSYDYDAPLNEAGDITEKYLAIRDYMLLSKPNLPPVPKNTEKKSYGDINVLKIGKILDLLDIVSTQIIQTFHPIPMEHIHHYYGFILYRHVLNKYFANSLLSVPGLRDRGYVLLDGQPVGVLQATLTTSIIMSAKEGQILDIIVENMGRFNFDTVIIDNNKGITKEITLNNCNLTDWLMYPVDIGNFFDKKTILKLKIGSLRFRPRKVSNLHSSQLLDAPSVYMGSFKLPKDDVAKDTFLDMCGWTWGVVYINGHNLGRFRPKLGPQTTLFLPSGFLKPYPEENIVAIFELENVQLVGPSIAKVVSLDRPQLNSTCFEHS